MWGDLRTYDVFSSGMFGSTASHYMKLISRFLDCPSFSIVCQFKGAIERSNGLEPRILEKSHMPKMLMGVDYFHLRLILAKN
jgi:hypothetical protein